MEPQQSGIKTWQWVVTVIVIIVLIVIGVMVFGGGDSDTEPVDGTGQDTVIAPGTNGIIMSDQYPGDVVYVSSVQVSSPGWIAIHKDNAGKPGAIIGSVYVAAGVNPARITLTEPVVDGGTYYAMLHSDNGDRKFDATVDLPLVDSRNNVIMRVFRGSASADANIKG